MKKLMPSTRLHIHVDQRVREGKNYLWITIGSTSRKKAGQEVADDIIAFREALLEKSGIFDKEDIHIANCVQAILSAYPNEPTIGKIHPNDFCESIMGRDFFRVIIPL